jgi:hypothetical protein
MVLDKEFSCGIIAYVNSLYASQPGHFAFRFSMVNQQSLSMKNEGPSLDVVENT